MASSITCLKSMGGGGEKIRSKKFKTDQSYDIEKANDIWTKLVTNEWLIDDKFSITFWFAQTKLIRYNKSLKSDLLPRLK